MVPTPVPSPGAPALSVAVVSHRQAALAVLERMPRGPALAPALRELAGGLQAAGVVGLSTCNRFEVYLETGTPLDVPALAQRLAALTGVPAGPLGEAIDVLHGRAAVRHLFAVCAGLESRLLGEQEILGQVRAAAREAEQEGTATPGLADLFRWAVQTGRRARRAAGLAESRISLATHAVGVLEQRLDGLAGRTVLVLGAGQMAGQVTAALRRASARPVVLVRRPEALSRDGVTVLGLGALPTAIDGADAVVCATSSPTPLLGADTLRRTAATRAHRPPLLVVDLAVPRNVEAPPGGVDGVTVLDLDALTDEHAGPALRAAARLAHDVVCRGAAAYWARRDRDPAGALIEQVLAHGEDLRRAELARAARLHPGVDPQVLEALTARLVAKLLHAPITAIREQAELGEDDVATLVAAALTRPGDLPGAAVERRAS